MSAALRSFVNGEEGDTVAALDRALHYGDGLFETMACLGGQVRLVDRHLARLTAGAARLGIATPAEAALRAELRRAASGHQRAVIKLIVTRGLAHSRGYAPSSSAMANRIMLVYSWAQDDGRAISEGVRVRTAALRLGENPALAGIKHCNRLEQVLARAEWSDPAIAESLLYSSGGALISGTMSNVFLVRGSGLVTPRLDRCGVAGVMRATVLAIAADLGIVASEERLVAEDLEGSTEMFLTNALIGIHPVRELDAVPLAPGPLTRRLQEALVARLADGGAHGG
jgi:4-amino-4-deoxychorismate lyase